MAVIYIELIDEGVSPVWRPVDAEPVSGNCYRLSLVALADEEWAYPPGSVVRCEQGGEDLYAVERVPPL